MAVTVTIMTPTVTVDASIYSVSVVATAVDGATPLGSQSFSTSTTETNAAAREQVATALANAIISWRSRLQLVQNAAPVLAQLKTAIEGKL